MPRILIVDDDKGVLSMLTVLLESEEYQVVSTADGKTARDLFLSEDFDLLISDIRMSPMDGMELLRAAHDERPAMSVIMLTAYGQVETAIEALQLGAFDYIQKPCKADELLDTVRRALECHDYMKSS